MWKAVAALAMAFVLGGCANMNQVANDVSTYSAWPADRKAATYTFERLPSQQANPQQQQMLEDAAARALEQAGFTAASDPQAADVSVTLGARVTATQISPYDDPFWWRGGLWASRFHGRPFGRHGFGHPFGPWGPWGAWGPWGPWGGYPRLASTTYEREVAILIRDRRTGQPLYEARAVNDGYSASLASLLPSMFQAAMTDFPHGGPNPRRVVTQIGP